MAKKVIVLLPRTSLSRGYTYRGLVVRDLVGQRQPKITLLCEKSIGYQLFSEYSFDPMVESIKVKIIVELSSVERTQFNYIGSRE